MLYTSKNIKKAPHPFKNKIESNNNDNINLQSCTSHIGKLTASILGFRL